MPCLFLRLWERYPEPAYARRRHRTRNARTITAPTVAAAATRGQTQADLPPSVLHILGDRKDLSSFAGEFKHFAPDAVIDLIAYTEQEARSAVETMAGIARRLVVLSSMDVYQAYDRLRRVDCSPPDPLPLTEEAPLRQALYPYTCA